MFYGHYHNYCGDIIVNGYCESCKKLILAFSCMFVQERSLKTEHDDDLMMIAFYIALFSALEQTHCTRM